LASKFVPQKQEEERTEPWCRLY